MQAPPATEQTLLLGVHRVLPMTAALFEAVSLILGGLLIGIGLVIVMVALLYIVATIKEL